MKILLLSLLSTTLLRAEFIPPTEGALLFRRDTLGLDANQQILLSKDFFTLVRRKEALATAAQRRATAQCLALALTLDPQAKGPRSYLQTLSNRTANNLTLATELETPLRNITKVALFLLEDSTDKKHRALAQLFLDPLAVIVPDNTIVLARPDFNESPRWRKIIAPVEKFAKLRE